MNRFHKLKKIEATDSLKHGRLNSKRRKTILRENDIFDILKKFVSLTQSEKIELPDSTDYPSFLGQNYENRDCTRVFWSNVSKSSLYPLHSM